MAGRDGFRPRDLWLFGYGSLIWRPDFEYLERRPARLQGWCRRFWQGSHDHRGVPDAPGRVVTLIREAAETCDGVAFRIDHRVAERALPHLDHREKNGYERHAVRLELLDADEAVDGLVYIAPIGNFAYLGPAPVADIAAQIHRSEGPSGRNVDYLQDLADALRELGAEDDHVFELEAAVRRLGA